MQKSSIQRLPSPAHLLIAITALFFSAVVNAQESDARQPVTVLADNARLYPDKGQAIYTGDVEIRQGSLEINAHQVTLYRNDQGDIERMLAEGDTETAHFRQKPAPDTPVVDAYAMTIRYNSLKQEVELQTQAQLHQGQDQFTGDRIRYHLQSRHIQAWGSDPESSDSSDQRVRIILSPADGAASP